jgi:hypothetical protein
MRKSNIYIIVLVAFMFIFLSVGLFFSPAQALIFGSNGTSGSTYTLITSGKYVSGYFQMGSANGLGDSISVYVSTTSEDRNLTAKLYDSSGNPITNGETIPTTITGSGFPKWITCSFSSSPSLIANAYYFIVVNYMCYSYTLDVYYATSGGGGVKLKTSLGFPATWTGTTTIDSDGILRAYVTYHLGAPEPPTNFIATQVLGTIDSIYLSWTKDSGADYTRIQYKTGSNPTSITDGTLAVNTTGSSYTKTGLNTDTTYYFSAWSFNNTNKAWSLTYISANAKTYGRPIKPSNLYGGFDLTNLKDIATWVLGTNATVTRIQYSTSSYPTTISSGTNFYNSSDNVATLSNTGYTTHYLSAWSWDNTAKLWSSQYTTVTIIINATCTGGSITVHNNTAHITGKYETSGSHIWLNYTGAIPTFTVYNNTAHTTKGYGTSWDAVNWIKYIWLNYTGILPTYNHYENIAHATGTHEEKTSDSGYTINDWANYTGDTPTITQYQNLNHASGTHQYSWDSALWKFYDWANYTGSLPVYNHYENIVNSTGTHEHSSSDSGYTINSWANYTGNTTPIHIIDNTNNVNGALSYILNSTGYWFTDTHNSWLYRYENPVNCVGQTEFTQGGGTWTIWANYTGTSWIFLHENIANATGTHEYSLDGNAYDVWANYTGNTSITPITLIDNTKNCLGASEYKLSGSGYTVYENYSADQPTINTYENIVNATGTHDWFMDNVGWALNIWANYTGDTTPLTLHEAIGYATGTHEQTLNNSGYDVYANYTSDISPQENLVNVSGSHDYSWDGSQWMVWANYTGNTTPVILFENYWNTLGTHEYILNGSGYTVWANASSNLSPSENIVNVTGTLDYGYDGFGSWLVWANYTGNTTALHQNQNIVNATGTHEYILNDTGYWDYANYTGTGGGTTPIHLLENIINATGTHIYLLNTSGYYVHANYTGYNHSLTIYNNSINVTGSYNTSYNTSTGNTIWLNYTGYGGGVNITLGNMTLYINGTQFSIIVLAILTGLFLFLGLVLNDKRGFFLVILAGVFSFSLFTAILLLFGGIWLFISPGFLIVSIIIFYKGCMMWYRGKKK